MLLTHNLPGPYPYGHYYTILIVYTYRSHKLFILTVEMSPQAPQQETQLLMNLPKNQTLIKWLNVTGPFRQLNQLII